MAVRATRWQTDTAALSGRLYDHAQMLHANRHEYEATEQQSQNELGGPGSRAV